jgi:hypothetical protein
MPLVIMLAGHGSVSAPETVISANFQGYQLFFTVKAGDVFCLCAHNIIAAMLTESVPHGITMLLQNPATEHFPQHSICASHTNVRCTISSNLIEHKIWPSLPELGRPDAFQLMWFKEYGRYDLIQRRTLDGQKCTTLQIDLDMKKICTAVLDLRARQVTAADLGNNQAVYMTPIPYGDETKPNKLLLSNIIAMIPQIQIVVLCAPRPADGMEIEAANDWFPILQGAGPQAVGSSSRDLLALRHAFVFLGEQNVERDLMRTIPDIARLEKYVFRFPVDSAIVAMICRGMDSGD